MNRLLVLIALLGFLLSLVVHVVTLLYIDVSEKIPFSWSLHVGIFLVFIPFVIFSRKDLGQSPTFSKLRKLFPSWFIALVIVIFVYAIVNAFLCILANEGGSPAIHDGKFILQTHGRLIRELSAVEYSSFRAREVRAFSGAWLFFYFIPFGYFMFRQTTNPSIERAV